LTLIVKVLTIKEGYNGHVIFENGDGTNYSMVVTPDPYGGYLFIVNNTATYRYYEDSHQVKFLCGNTNNYTKRAILQIARSLI